MIGKPEWFARRKYTGWGFTPKTWQGWVYIIAVILPFVLIQSISALSSELRMILTVIWAVFFAIDSIDIMSKLNRDEREKIHEAFAERNALWAMMIVLVIGIAYQSAQSVVKGFAMVDPVIIAALLFGLAAKAITNYYLYKKD